MATVDVRPFEDADAPAVAALAASVGWPSLADPDVAARVSTAPGAAAYVAQSRSDQTAQSRSDQTAWSPGDVVGWAQAMGDGVLQSHLGHVAVHADHRRRGIARLLVVAVFQATGTKRMDLVTDLDARGFYEAFGHQRMAGFRIFPGA